MPKSNITISRYVDPNLGWEACIRPDSGDWVMFVPRPEKTNLAPTLFHRVGTCVDEHGDTHDAYAAEGSEQHKVFLSEYNGVGLSEAYDQEKIDATRARLEAEYEAEAKKQG